MGTMLAPYRNWRLHRLHWGASISVDDEFEPKLGRIRRRGSKRGSRYLQRVLQAAALTGRVARGSSGKFHGNRIGRGSGVGRVLAARDHYAAFRQRRVIVKSRIVKLKGTGLKAAQQHLRYIQRDGVTRDGERGELYDAKDDRVAMKPFLERCGEDRHQFRIIVSAEDGAEYANLKPLTRRLMHQIEEDLGTKLDWVAVDHFNTGHPHTHIVLRGKDDRGRDLIIARDYIAEGMRERAAEIVSLDLGSRTDREIEDRLRGEVEQERLTSLDRDLMQRATGKIVNLGDGGNAFRQSLRAGRLQKLKRLGLADEIEPGHWQLSADLERTLRSLGERGDIIKTMHRDLSANGIARAACDYAIFDPSDVAAQPITGRIAARGLSDELKDRHYLIVDGTDGRAHYIDIGDSSADDALRFGSIVQVEPRVAQARDVDRTIARIAEQNAGRYSAELHHQADSSASREFVEAHVRRLEAMRKLGGLVEREVDGSWRIAPDHVERSAIFERGQARASPIVVRMLSALPLEKQLDSEGATWLDRTLASGGEAECRDAGFGHEARDAFARRRQWLIEQGLAIEDASGVSYKPDLLTALTRRELSKTAAGIARETGLAYVEAGRVVEGVYRRSFELASGRFAMIEKSREFTLVPWRPVLERNLGKAVFGIARGESISWSLGRQRSGPSVS